MKQNMKNLTLSAMFLALGLVLPFLTGQIPQIGSMLLPMHIPVFLCGLICGWQYGGLIGAILPPLRYALFGMPILYPTGIAMMAELATYGIVAGFLYQRSRWQCLRALYRAIITAMVSGRAVWALAEIALLGISADGFTWQMFISGALLNAIPGIIVQLILLPAVMVALNRTGLVRFRKDIASQTRSDSVVSVFSSMEKRGG